MNRKIPQAFLPLQTQLPAFLMNIIRVQTTVEATTYMSMLVGRIHGLSPSKMLTSFLLCFRVALRLRFPLSTAGYDTSRHS